MTLSDTLQRLLIALESGDFERADDTLTSIDRLMGSPTDVLEIPALQALNARCVLAASAILEQAALELRAGAQSARAQSAWGATP